MIINQSGGILARLSITNILWLALLGASWQQGWLQYLFEKDITFISHGIALATFFVVLVSLWKGLKLGRLLSVPESVKSVYAASIKRVGVERRADLRDALKIELVSYVAFIEYFATTALAVGVLGTVIGLILGFQNVDPMALSNVENAGATVAEVLKGLSVAFHTTLVGGIANLWLRTNHFMLSQANSRLFTTVMEG
jgi:hypothetical protein